MLRYDASVVTSVFSLVGTDLGTIFYTLPEQADVFSVSLLFSYFLKFAPMGDGPFHRQATITRRSTAGDHKGPPFHSSPLSPLRMVMAFLRLMGTERPWRSL